MKNQIKKINTFSILTAIFILLLTVFSINISSVEAMSRSEAESAVRRAYQQCLGRNPESSGLNHHVNIILNGKRASEVHQDICKSEEARRFATSGTSSTTSSTTSARPSAPSCPFSTGTNKYVVNLGQGIRADQSQSNSRQLVNANLPAGTYNIRIMTWDPHSHHGAQGQNNEQVVLSLLGSGGTVLHTTNRSQDIPGNRDSIISTLSTNAVVSSNVQQVLAYHPEYPSSNPQSLTPICAEFTRVATPTPIVGQCGAAANRYYSTPPTSGLCSSGTPSTPLQYDSVNKIWYWSCMGNDGIPDSADDALCATAPPTPTPTLNASCSVSNRNLNVGDRTTFTANATGGSGSYTYRWFNDVSDTRRTFSQRFNHRGSYRASVEVTDSEGRRQTANCPVVVVEDDVADFNIQCNISRTNINVGDRVNIDVDINGGRSPHYIDWSGDARLINGFNLTRQSQSVRINTPGTYRLRVDVEDRDGNRDSDTCTVRVRDDRQSNINVISSTTPTPPSGDLAGLSSVYLNQVPYTGPEDVLKVVGFIALVLIWSSAIAYYFMKDRKKKVVSNKIEAFKEANRARLNI